jgi:hypothetical protein
MGAKKGSVLEFRHPTRRSSTHGDTHRLTPLPDALVADAVDGAVGPFRRGARERLGVGVAGGGVEGERAEGGAGAGAVDLDFADVEEGAEAAPIPRDVHLGAADGDVDVRREGGVIGAALLGAFDAEGGADGFVIGRAAFHLFHEGAEPDFDPGRDSGNSRGQRGRDRGAAGREIAAGADEVFPASPLRGAVADQLLAGEDVAVVIGIGRLRGDLCRGEPERGGVSGDGVFKSLELGGKGVVVEWDVTRFRHW